MSNEYDFESGDDYNSNSTNNGPINNSSSNGPINNGSNNGNGGIPLIAIIGIMALIILGLIIYIVVDEVGTKEVNVMNTQDYEVQTEIEEEPIIEDEEIIENTIIEEEPIISEDEDTETAKNEVIENDTNNLTSDWKSCEFAIEGKKYKLNDLYKSFTENGWYIDLEQMGYSEGYILNKNDKTYSTVDLLNDDFEDSDVSVGFINNSESAQDITECAIWAIDVDNSYTDTPVDFELPGGIKNGATLAEIEAVYGKPEEDDIYRSESLGYTNYSYVYDYSIYLDLTVYDEEGLVEFDYKIYE